MDTVTVPPKHFTIQFRDKSYPVETLELRGRAVYKINFGNSYLHLIKVNALDGPDFWAPIPEDKKLAQVCIELGQCIEKSLKEN